MKHFLRFPEDENGHIREWSLAERSWAFETLFSPYSHKVCQKRELRSPYVVLVEIFMKI